MRSSSFSQIGSPRNRSSIHHDRKVHRIDCSDSASFGCSNNRFLFCQKMSFSPLQSRIFRIIQCCRMKMSRPYNYGRLTSHHGSTQIGNGIIHDRKIISRTYVEQCTLVRYTYVCIFVACHIRSSVSLDTI